MNEPTTGNILHLGSYVTAQAVRDHMSSDGGLRQATSLLRKFGIAKAYLEVYRGGLVIEPSVLKTARDYLRSQQIEVAGGIATVPGDDFGVRQNTQFGWFNWQAEKTLRDLERVIQQSALLFEEFIVDDFLCTADTSPESEAARGARTWGEYRRDLLTEISQKLVRAAHEENPSQTIIIKYPQWYDRFHLFGYDVVREPQIYDRVWVGTETRGPDTREMGYVKQYEGFANYCWLSSLSGDKIGGAWFDHIDCTRKDYLEQAYQSVLAGARDIILFNYYDLVNDLPGYYLLRDHLPRLAKLAEARPRMPAWGVYGYKPPHSDPGGEHYIFDYLGMIGIPLIPCSRFPQDARVVFLPTQAAADPNIKAQIQQHLQKGGTLILTVGFLNACGIPLTSLTGIAEIKPVESLRAIALLVAGQTVEFSKGLEIGGTVRLESARVLLSAQIGGERIPYLTCKDHGAGSKVYVLNSHTFSEQDFADAHEGLLAPRDLGFLDLPVAWLTEIRGCFNEPLGVDFQAPSRTAVYLLGEKYYVICNFNNQDVGIALNFRRNPNAGFIDVYTGEGLPSVGRGFSADIPKRQMRWVRRI